MALDKLKNSISLSILSIIGYLYLVYYLLVHFINTPQMYKEALNEANIDSVTMAVAAPFVGTMIAFAVLSLILLAFFVISAIIEYFLRKKKIIPEFITSDNNIYKTFFWIGLFMQLTPILYFFFTLILPNIIFQITYNP